MGHRIGRAALIAFIHSILVATLARAALAQSNWVQLQPPTSPSPNGQGGIAYDDAAGNMVLFGGANSFTINNETWVFDGTTWTQLQPANSPSPRNYFATAYDAARGVVTVFGGCEFCGGGGYLGDTWTWNGSNWTQQNPATSPSGRDDVAMAYDASNQTIVLFGGETAPSGAGAELNDTWTWNGTTWTEQNPATNPPIRNNQSMAYDPAHGVVVLFGGGGPNGHFLNDTWTWDGTNWTQQTPATSPPARVGASMAYDPVAGGVVLFGGLASDQISLLNDTWLWSGSNWSQLLPTSSPPSRGWSQMDYDAQTGALTLFGGQIADNGFLGDTWTFTSAPGAALAIHVKGNHLVDQNGDTVSLMGVNRSGTEYMCVGGAQAMGPLGIFDVLVPGGVTVQGGVTSDSPSVPAMASWNINAVRVPLNEDCWLGVNVANLDPSGLYTGQNYRTAVMSYVSQLNSAGLYVILDLHWNAPDKCTALHQQEMADADHSEDFWTSVAKTFKNNPAVVFDLYNEPYGITWDCWKNGCSQKIDTLKSCAGTTGKAKQWETAGMQNLVNEIRKAGATQPIMLGGLGAASDLSGWLNHEPTDPLQKSASDPVRHQAQLVASVHSYCGQPTAQSTQACEQALKGNQSGQWPVITKVAKKVPVVTGEFGEFDCATTYVTPYMSFADSNGVSYLGWAWDVHPTDPNDCYDFPALISDYSGTPTPYGSGLKDHLASFQRGP